MPVHDRSDRRTARRRRRPGRLHAVAPDAVHPERDDRRRPVAAVQLAVHVLRPVLRPRRRPDRQGRRHRLRAAQGRRPAGRRARTASSAPPTTCRPSLRFMVLTRGQNQPGPDGIARHRRRHPGRRTTPTRRGSTRARPTPRTPRTRCSCASTRWTAASRSRPASCSAARRGRPAARPTARRRMATWAPVKQQAATMLGLQLIDKDVSTSRCSPPTRTATSSRARTGLPQYVTDRRGLVEGNLAERPVAGPGRTSLHFDTPFLNDIAHNADPERRGTGPDAGTPQADARRRQHAGPTSRARPRARTTTSCSTRTSSPVTAAATRTSADHDPPDLPLRARPARGRHQAHAERRPGAPDRAAGRACPARPTRPRPTAGTASGSSRRPGS